MYFYSLGGNILIIHFSFVCICCVSCESLWESNSNSNIALEGCTDLLAEFASSVADFTHCAIMNARPIRLCESCVRHFRNVTEAHEEILNKAENGTGEACRKKLINLDRLEIVEHGYENVRNLWENGHCDSCFSSSNSTVESNSTLTFNDLYNKTNICIENHYVEANKSYNPTVCTSCSDAYCKMNEFYELLKESESDGNICIDIVDSMNRSRSQWSITLKCGRKNLAPEVPLLLSLVFVSLTPVAFYIAAKIFSSKAESRVIPQKRLGQLHSSYKRIVS